MKRLPSYDTMLIYSESQYDEEEDDWDGFVSTIKKFVLVQHNQMLNKLNKFKEVQEKLRQQFKDKIKSFDKYIDKQNEEMKTGMQKT